MPIRRTACSPAKASSACPPNSSATTRSPCPACSTPPSAAPAPSPTSRPDTTATSTSRPRTYQPDKGALLYRRGLYTHWQRTFLHPMLKAFDAPAREECTAGTALLQHPAPGAQPAQRPDLHRGRPRPGHPPAFRSRKAKPTSSPAPGSAASSRPPTDEEITNPRRVPRSRNSRASPPTRTPPRVARRR